MQPDFRNFGFGFWFWISVFGFGREFLKQAPGKQSVQFLVSTHFHISLVCCQNFSGTSLL